MTFSNSKRLLEAYKTCRGIYIGLGPVGIKPKRLRVVGFFPKRRKWKLRVALEPIRR